MANFFGLIGCVIVLVALLDGAAAQTTHLVLDNQGWIIPTEGASAYTNWTATKTFMVGDTLVFNFASNQHDVVEVTKMEYDACTATSTTGPILMNSPVNITLTTPGQHYYICTFTQHCALGQKLAINVSGSPSTTPAPPTSPTTTAAPPTTPTASGPTAAKGPTAGCPPETTGPPAAGGPTSTTPPNSAGVAANTNNFLVIASMFIILMF
ncbi:hypothetical protein AQUCO_02000099v1 [Aquilegia coerulea]|uniref:Phytocyanin domain-containing protein n=1 Tax=Aquilegia coerulea TaxID=218851 RepID=A0A2G5DFV8_AQUCA|nr:hypothetical protein AQUCO_02000099v1 [Aquilegia coerulea]